jgi:hypothetical protein
VNYLLIVITHGGDKTLGMLRDTLASFEEMVTPKPRQRVLIEDGAKKSIEWRGQRFWSVEPQGFCKTAALGWSIAGSSGVEFVYWLEHDFLHERPVNLADLALVLKRNRKVAQVSLMRQPVNLREIRAGGVVEADKGCFVPHRISENGGAPHRWLEHGRYWTTNPSLFPTAIAREHPWPAVQECEGHMGISLRQEGYSFAVWGDGRPWVKHVGERTGFGY